MNVSKKSKNKYESYEKKYENHKIKIYGKTNIIEDESLSSHSEKISKKDRLKNMI